MTIYVCVSDYKSWTWSLYHILHTRQTSLRVTDRESSFQEWNQIFLWREMCWWEFMCLVLFKAARFFQKSVWYPAPKVAKDCERQWRLNWMIFLLFLSLKLYNKCSMNKQYCFVWKKLIWQPYIMCIANVFVHRKTFTV